MKDSTERMVPPHLHELVKETEVDPITWTSLVAC